MCEAIQSIFQGLKDHEYLLNLSEKQQFLEKCHCNWSNKKRTLLKAIPSSHFFETLPMNIYYCLREHLTSSEFLSLLHTSKQLRETKQLTMYYRLNRHYSEEFLQNSQFRQHLLARIKNSSAQIHLQVSEIASLMKCPQDCLPHQITMTLIFPDCLSNVTLISNPAYFQQYREQVKDFSFAQLTNPPTVAVRFGGFTRFADEHPKKEKESKYDILLHSSAYSYSLDHFYIGFNQMLQNVSPFMNMKKLILQSCSAVVDVRPLASIHYLELIECNGIEDISPLSNVYHLTLSSCEGVRDISPLRYNTSLAIENCSRIKSFDCLSRTKSRSIKLQHPQPIQNLVLSSSVQDLSLSTFRGSVEATASLRKITLFSCPLLIAPAYLQILHTIKLHNCYQMTNLCGFGNIHSVIIDQCHDLTTLEGLGGNNYKVQIINCANLTDFSALKTIPIVKIQSCRRFKRCEDVALVEDLTIHDTFALDRIHSLQAVRELTLSQCYRMNRVDTLPGTLQTLKIIDCDEFLPDENQLELRKCSKIAVTLAGNFVDEALERYQCCLQTSHQYTRRGNTGTFLRVSHNDNKII